jgi:ligand-binding sensor domain-containing protein/putative methionine-R-sulfoxide reductase with GAF domain
MYNGHSVSLYLKEKNPELASDLVTNLFCDDQNRVWIGTNEGCAWMDAKRKLHRVVLEDSVVKFNTKAIIQTSQLGVILITNLGHYNFEEKKNKWHLIRHATDQFPYAKIKAVRSLGTHEAMLVTDTTIYIYDYATEKVFRQYVVPGVVSICPLRGNEIAVGKSTGQIDILNAVSGQTVRKYLLNTVSSNSSNTPQPLEIKQGSNGNLVVATGLNGLITITPSGVISHFVHDPINPNSLVSTSTYRLATGKNGEVVVGTSTSGLSIYNTQLIQAGFKGFFTDESGSYYDNYTGRMVESGNNIIWIGTYDRLIRWDKNVNTSRFFYYTDKKEGETVRGDIRAMCLDKFNKLWVSIDKKGLACFSVAEGFQRIKLDTSKSAALGASDISELLVDDEGLIWACTNKGIFTIDPSTKKAQAMDNHPVLKALSGKVVYSAFIDSKKRMWFTTIHDGVYTYDKNKTQLDHYTSADGLPSDICYMVKEDKKGRLFIPTSKGLAIIDTDLSIRSFTKRTALRYERCESVLIDNENIAWFSNKNCLVRFDADNNHMEIFDEKAGLLNDGFRVGSCLKARNGELLWGGYKGVSYFKPKQLKTVILPLQVNIHQVEVQDSTVDIPAEGDIRVPYVNNNIAFKFAGIHLGIPGKTYYQYRLTGYDQNWQRAEDIQQVRYATLPPGNYRFELKASIDGINWIASANKIDILIVPPLWMRWWFITVVILLSAAIIYWFIDARNKKLSRQKEQRKADRVIKYFASSLHDQQTVETILWDVARNCVNFLRFEECFVYLLDDTRNVLVQKAVYRPGDSIRFSLNPPQDIPVGTGIVGRIALSGKPELIAGATAVSEGLLADESNLAEVAVPLIWGGRVIGVIDWRHSERHHFTEKHLSVLVTIASLCANKIIRARAEEEKQRAQTILTSTQQKMAEVEMQALRAQMNPHFIFNCLNSINRYILKSDEATASLYLTRFAKLMRLILDNSSSKNVLLSNELEALKLYIEMEALRFDKKFSYEIIIDRNVNTDSIELPSLIIQPYVENAIWHGLLHKDGGGRLIINIKMTDRGMLECIIEDNGVGRVKAKELKSKSATSRKSHGMQLTQSRLALLNRHAELNASISIIDMEDVHKQPAGTKVILCIPV